jgi:hypothetical protein
MKVLEQEARTVAVKACCRCTSGLLEWDRFCRRCGARQPDLASTQVDPATEANELAAGFTNRQSYLTANLETAARAIVYRRISAPLVDAVVTGALAGPSRRNQGACARRMILALISIPVWLIIVLLSPLDAYAAVKNLAR